MSARPDPPLEQVQAWLHTFVVSPGSGAEALSEAEQKSGLESGSAEQLVLPSPRLSPRERIEIYRGMYLLRMVEAMEIDFPAVQWLVGKRDFSGLVESYVKSYPSRSYTLDHLGRHFSQFLAEQSGLAQAEALADLSRLEWAMAEVAIALDSPCLSMSDLASVVEENFLRLVFAPVPALRILRSQWDINRVLKDWANDLEPSAFEPRPTHLAVWRNDLKVWRMELDEPCYAFLQGLLQGHSLGESLDHTLASHGSDEETLFDKFQGWLSEGFFGSFLVESDTD